LKAEAESAEAEWKLAQIEAAVAGNESPDAKTLKELEAAKKRRDAAKQQLEQANAALDRDDINYSPLGEVYPQTSSGRRLALARWIASPENPLTARVAVNHVWMRHFGTLLVETVFDFGLNGAEPTHPQLLDWLASELMSAKPQAALGTSTQHSWSFKRLHRLIVTSAAYRRQSFAPADHPNFAIDRDNRCLWRMNARRMESEIVRDSVLAASHQLDERMGGPELDAALGATTYRRSIYYRHAPEKFMPFLMTFDAASTHECYRRSETVVPQQALALANSRLVREQSRRLARRFATDLPDEEFITAAFEQILGRPPTQKERGLCTEFLASQTERLRHEDGLTSIAGGPKPSVTAAEDPHQRAREGLVH
ncbi:MAG: DUF1553 domain-containing protein, partial [Planctomycetaceae bacterium]